MEPRQALPALVAERLAPHQARLAFPLMREVVPGLTLATWLRFTRRMAGRGNRQTAGSWSPAMPPRPYLCGAVCYRRDHDPGLGIVLTAEHFVAVDLLHPRAVLNTLETGLEAVAFSLGCAAVRTMVGTPGTARDLRDSGHRPAGEVLLRRVRPLPRPAAG